MAENNNRRYKRFLEPDFEGNIPKATKWRLSASSSAGCSVTGYERPDTTESHPSDQQQDDSVTVGGQTIDEVEDAPVDIDNESDHAEPPRMEPSDDHLDTVQDGSAPTPEESELPEDEDNTDEWFSASEDWEDWLEDGDKKLATAGTVTRAEAILLILVFYYKHGLNLGALGDLMVLINTLFGYEAVPRSLHLLQKMVKGYSSLARFHFFCPSCMTLLCTTSEGSSRKRKLWCELCKEWCTASIGKGNNYFITMSVAEQLKRILRKYASFLCFTSSREGIIRDICDGVRNKALRAKTGTSHMISLLFSTDGSPVFKSNGKSIWPITAFVNEIAPKMRYRLPILAGIWCGIGHVPMTMFFRAFVTEMDQLGKLGVRWMHDGRQIVSKVFAVCACPDTLGRSALQNHIRFNGFYGCSWCLHPGKFLQNQVRYVTQDVQSPFRTDREIRRDAKAALESGNAVRGVKGPSCLYNLPAFDLVSGYVPDYMHCVCLGVVKMMTELWFSTKNHAEAYYIGQKKNVLAINARLLGIRPPKVVTRLPRVITTRKDWKASEWRAWLLFYAVPCLSGIIESQFLKHFSLLSSAIFILLQDKIMTEEVRRAEAMLFEYVVTCEILYGTKIMTSNVHQLLHLAESVKRWGPLWAHSAFPFEDWNGRLLKYVHGTRSAANQILNHFSVSKTIDAMLNTIELSPQTNAFCRKILGHKSFSQCSASGHVSVGLGCGTTGHLGAAVRSALQNCLTVLPEGGTFFKRMLHMGMILDVSERQYKHSDCYIMTHEGLCLELRNIIQLTVENERIFFLVGVPLKSIGSSTSRHYPMHTRIMERGSDDDIVAVRAATQVEKCVAVTLHTNHLAISRIPSTAWGD
ncbi:uncharacterized protein LOC122373208 [Amphibalanus amphitrite]|uniref:uncharacterized protein LOC122373208 n=1 Tax=Amphibalanus amphitrite TaxID=1232801 RepID=UPI001C913D73|nr:uncharacterized protein LOC122373208 [Amphibalanus amphitrite]